MPVPTVITDLSTTAASNSPAGSDAPGPDGDNHIRALAAFIAQLYAGSTSVAAGMLKSTGSAIAVGTADVDYQSALTAASQAEMEAGTESAVRKMSPLRVAQAISALGGIDQIQSISAAVGSNALTISAGTLSLDFRSATLGSGTVTRVTGDPADLVISSGSTLGTVNGVASRVVVIAMNNAGTIELAATNIAGGVNLDETGLISTTAEGGAGAADSATVIYSATARSNLAYRVLGYIESTQATAGTWATAPSTIQGSGGQALTSMGSLGWGQSWVVDGSGITRVAGTTYYNTTGKPIMVIISDTTYIGDIVVGGVSLDPTVSANVVSVTFVVPPSKSYVYTAGSSLARWAELR